MSNFVTAANWKLAGGLLILASVVATAFPLLALKHEIEMANMPAEDSLVGRCDMSKPVTGPEQGDPAGRISCTADDGSSLSAACGSDITVLDLETGYLVCKYPAGSANPDRMFLWSVLSAYPALSVAAGLLFLLGEKLFSTSGYKTVILPPTIVLLSVLQIIVMPYLIQGWLALSETNFGVDAPVISDFFSATRIIFIAQGVLGAIMIVQMWRKRTKVAI